MGQCFGTTKKRHCNTTTQKRVKFANPMCVVKYRSVVEREPAILKLDVAECIDLFDFLSIKDLISLGGTCDRMNRLAGSYFQGRYQYKKCSMHKTGIQCDGIPADHFAAFMQHIELDCDNFDDYHIQFNGKNTDCFSVLGSDCESLKCIDLVRCDLTAADIYKIKSILFTVEKLTINNCCIEGDFYENFLKFCPNLKHLVLRNRNFNEVYIINDSWLEQEYPSLEVLEFCWYNFASPNTKMVINESRVKTFFDVNPIVTFKTDIPFLTCYMKSLLLANAALDEFIVFGHQPDLFPQLIELYQHGFYEEMHIFVSELDENLTRQIDLCPIVYEIRCRYIATNVIPVLPNLKELQISFEKNNDFAVIPGYFEDLTELLVENARFDQILPFIRQSKNLTKIYISWIGEGVYIDEKVVDLVALNEHREKADDAEKIKLYVEESVYLATKWTIPSINLSKIQLKMFTDRNDHKLFG